MNRYSFTHNYKMVPNRPTGFVISSYESNNERHLYYVFFKDGLTHRHIDVSLTTKRVVLIDFDKQVHVIREKNTKEKVKKYEAEGLAGRSKVKKIGDELWFYHQQGREILTLLEGRKYKVKSIIEIPHEEYLAQ